MPPKKSQRPYCLDIPSEPGLIIVSASSKAEAREKIIARLEGPIPKGSKFSRYRGVEPEPPKCILRPVKRKWRPFRSGKRIRPFLAPSLRAS